MYRKLIVPAIAVLGFAAQPSVAQELTGTLKKIKDNGAITIGHRESSVPFSYYDDNQKVIGYAMDLCYKIADAVKKELKLQKLDVKLNPITSATRIPLMANGTVDLECGSTTNNLERQQQVGFTITHFVTANRFVSKKAANLKKVDDLKGSTITSTSGTTNIKQITEVGAQKNLGLNILPAKDHRGLPDGGDRSCQGLRHGRHSALQPGGDGEEPGRLCHLPGRIVGRTLRHHGAPRRPRL